MRVVLVPLVAAVVALVVNPGSAAAETMSATVSRDCSLAGLTGPISASLSANIQNPAYLYPAPSESRVTASLTVPTADLRGAAVLAGTVRVNLVTTDKGGTRREVIAMDFRKVAVTPGTVTIPLVGYTSRQTTVPHEGVHTVDVDTLDVRIQLGRADGTSAGELTGVCTGAPTRWQTFRVDNVIAEILPGPGGLAVTGTTSDSVSISYNATSGPFWDVVGYEVYVDERAAVQVPGLTATVGGLQPDTSYWLRVAGIDSHGNRGALGPPFEVRTAPAAYRLTGTARVKGAAVALTGSFDSTVKLDPTKAEIRLGGVLPLAADVTFGPVETTTTLVGGVLTATAKVAIGLPRVTLFGLPISQSPTCATTVPAEVALSGTGFDPAVGGTLTGTFAMPALSGCGSATPLLSAFVAGPGNTVEVRLAP
ncbi:fibronectin type III domain-containing protein [Actinokineospora sp. HUAS TT18]|uniref:fibronectin type III domain-containing protein n=1 Tax=Actinokineospora sp. HUAS TT18 TaxID=3447451 RepID=UPI003F51CD45